MKKGKQAISYRWIFISRSKYLR